MKAVVMSDLHVDALYNDYQMIDDVDIIINDYKQTIPDLDVAIIPGDLFDWAVDKSPMSDKADKLIPKLNAWVPERYGIMGNHDLENGTQTEFTSLMGHPEYYSILKGNNIFIFISDTTRDGGINTTALDWLENEISSNQDKNVFVITHRPPYDIGQYLSDNTYYIYLTDTSNRLKSIAQTYDIKAWFYGHTHPQSYETNNTLSMVDGILFCNASASTRIFQDTRVMTRYFELDDFGTSMTIKTRDHLTNTWIDSIEITLPLNELTPISMKECRIVQNINGVIKEYNGFIDKDGLQIKPHVVVKA